MNELDSLQERTKYKFIDIKLLNKALTHKSYANEKSENLKNLRAKKFERSPFLIKNPPTELEGGLEYCYLISVSY